MSRLEQLWRLAHYTSGFIHWWSVGDPAAAQLSWHRATSVAQAMILGLELTKKEEIRQAQLDLPLQED